MSGGLSNGARESCGCGDLSHCSQKGCRLLVSGDRWFIEVGGANRCEICDGKVQFFCLINGGNRDVFWFWFRGIFIVTSKSKTDSFFWVRGSINWSPLASVPGSFFSIDSESMVDRSWSVNFKLVV